MITKTDIGYAAFAASDSILDDAFEDVCLVLGGEWRKSDDDALCPQMARFVITAGDVGGEALYRWMAGKNLHPLPGDGYAQVSEPIRVFFECFVATVKALAGVLMPKAQHATMAMPAPNPRPSETIFEKHEGPLARTYAGIHEAPPVVWKPPGASGAAVASAGTQNDAGEPPSREEFMQMSPEERRPWAHLFGLSDWRTDPDITTRAPPLDGVTRDVRPTTIPREIEPGVTVPVTVPAHERRPQTAEQDDPPVQEASAPETAAGTDAAAETPAAEPSTAGAQEPALETSAPESLSSAGNAKNPRGKK